MNLTKIIPTVPSFQSLETIILLLFSFLFKKISPFSSCSSSQQSNLLLCFCAWIFFFFSSLINHIMQYLSLYVCLITLSKMSSMLIHLVKKVIFYCFLRLNNISLYPIHILLIYLSVDVQLGFSMSLLQYNAAMNIRVKILL